MIALQEELDWQCYQLYGLVTDDLRYTGDDLPEIALGQRAFEIVMARQMQKGELQTSWFERHGSTPITEIPDALAGRLPQTGRTSHQADRDEQGNRPDREARVQTPLEHRAVGGARAAGLEELAARPTGRQTLLAERGTAIDGAAGRPSECRC